VEQVGQPSPRFRRNQKEVVWQRDGGQCRYCGEPADCLGHVVPKILGGPTTEEVK